MSDLFDVPCESIVARPEMLSLGYIPDRLLSRDKEIGRVGEIFLPVFGGGMPHNSIIYGLTGSGKTACLRHVIQKFKRAIDKKNVINPPFIYSTRCVDAKGPIDILIKTILSINKKSKIRTGFSSYVYYDELFKILNKKKRGLILVLDEIDALKNTDLLYMLSRAGEMGDLAETVYICIIGLTNNVQYPSTLDPRVHSSFGSHWILFPPYSALDLIQILEDRRHAYIDGAIEEGVIPFCAALAASDHGDARQAIELFRTAGEMAVRDRATKISEDHVRRARKALDRGQITDLLKKLPTQTALILISILVLKNKGNTTPTTGEVSKCYQTLATNFCIDPLTHRRVTMLLTELIMLGLIDSKKQSLGRAGGNVREVWLTVSDEEEVALIENVATRTDHYFDYLLLRRDVQ